MCRDCRKRFQHKKRKARKSVTSSLWSDYVWGKQTVAELADQHHVSAPVIRGRLDAYQIPVTYPYQELKPQPLTLVIDAYFRSRSDGTLIFRSPELKRNLLWYDITHETVGDYVRGVKLMQEAGWIFTGFTIDGRKGVAGALEQIAAVQYCQFHQKKTIRTYLTLKPQLEAAIELKEIVSRLTMTDEASFSGWLNNWHQKWSGVLKERTVHPGGGWSYTHRRLRSSYRSLKTNLPWLFTYQKHQGLPNTTNSLDGSISHLRTMHRVHRGLQLQRRRKVTDTLLRGKYPR